jgi:hypothetical protein
MIKVKKMKRYVLLILLITGIFNAGAQTADDFGRIALRSDVSSVAKISEETKSILTTKLNQIATNYGIAASEVNPRFVITAKIDVISKDIVPGPPQMVSQKLQITFFVGDATEQKLFGNTSVSITGTGTNETKAYINALNKINPNNPGIKTMIEESKTKIIAYYSQACEMILKEAQTLSGQGKYDQTIYNLSLIPDVCSECYQSALNMQGAVYTKKIDAEGREIFQQAQTLWAASPNRKSANEVMRQIVKINPGVSFAGEVQTFVKQVSNAVEAQELREWEQQVQEYKDRVEAAKKQADAVEAQELRKWEQQVQEYKDRMEAAKKQTEYNYQLEQIRIRAYRDIAVEYAKNQTKEIYNSLTI